MKYFTPQKMNPGFYPGKMLVLVFALWIFMLQPEPAVSDTQLNIGTQRVSLNLNGHILKIPCYRNFSRTDTSGQVQRGVIVIHGSSRNADSYYQSMLLSEFYANGTDSTSYIIAPQFLIESDISQHNLPDSILFWKSSGWKKGDKSRSTGSHYRPERISSFAVIDTIVMRMAQRYPNLQKIVLIGHSAGGQFVNRYAAGNRLEPLLATTFGIHMRYVVANPSSYVYFNNERRVIGTIDQFAVPPGSTSVACPDYNKYKYGLDNLNSYMGATGASQIRTQYGVRDVVYLLGKNDNDPNASSLDKTCMAMLQGDHRLERGKIYYNYVKHYYGHSIINIQKLAVLPGIGHDHDQMFTHPCAQYFVFDASVCNYVGIDDRPPAVSIPADYFLEQNFPNPFNPETQISFGLPETGRVRIDVVNLLGQKVTTLLDQLKTAGRYNVSFNGKNLPSGIYYYRLQAGKFIRVRKMLLLR